MFVAVGADLGDVWAATLTSLRQRGWPPTDVRQGRATGIITTDWFHVGSRGAEYMDCGDEDYPHPHSGRVRVEMFARAEGVEVDIQSRWRGRTESRERHRCLTRGVAEDELRMSILALLDSGR